MAYGIPTPAPQLKSPLKNLDIMVEDAAPPWSRSDGKGYSNDIVVAAFKEMGVRVHLRVVPYARCKRTVLAGKVVACFSMGWHSDFEGRILLATEPIIFLNSDVFENVDRPLPRPQNNQCTLPEDVVIGITRDYEYPPETMALHHGRVRLEIFHSDSYSLKSLAAKRIGAAIIMTNDLEPREQKAIESDTQKKVRFAFPCGTITGSIGFSVQHPQGLAAFKLYQEGYQRIKKNGKLNEIRNLWTKSSPGNRTMN